MKHVLYPNVSAGSSTSSPFVLVLTSTVSSPPPLVFLFSFFAASCCCRGRARRGARRHRRSHWTGCPQSSKCRFCHNCTWRPHYRWYSRYRRDRLRSRDLFLNRGCRRTMTCGLRRRLRLRLLCTCGYRHCTRTSFSEECESGQTLVSELLRTVRPREEDVLRVPSCHCMRAPTSLYAVSHLSLSAGSHLSFSAVPN